MSAPSKTDLMYEITYNPSFVPIRSPKVNVKVMTVDGEETFIMKNHITGSYLSLSEFAYDLWKLLDGKRDMQSIIEEAQGRWIAAAIRPDLVKQGILFYAEKGALKSSFETPRKSRVRVASAFEIDLAVLQKSAKLVRSVLGVVRPLLRRPLLWLSLAFIAFCAVAFAGNFVILFIDKSNFQILGSSVVGFFFYSLIILLPVHIIHEFAHGIALAHYGGTPGEMGTGLFYFSPMFYVDTTDAWTLTRRQRIMVYLAGNISTLMIGSTVVVLNYLLRFPPFVSHVLSVVAFYCFLMSLVNLAPPFETDGYYVLCDLVKVPNLRQDSFSYLKTVVRRVSGKRVEEPSDLTSKKKRILLGYAILSAIWIVFILFQTLTFTRYMAQDTLFFALKISSAILLSETLSMVTVVVSISTFVYFAMTIMGYGLMLASAIKKATRGVLKFEALHDRDFSVFLYLPKGSSDEIVSSLKARIAEVAEDVTPSFVVESAGSLCYAVLRMGGTELPLVRIREHLKKIEIKFRSMYQDFLEEHKSQILEPMNPLGHQNLRFSDFVSEMAGETGAAASEAKAVVDQIIDKQTEYAFYLLNSSFGAAWTIELPPQQQWRIQKEMLSTFFIEDLAITDLYDEIEDFKKGVVYGFDSLAELSRESQKGLDEILSHPEKYHAASFFEPVKGRLMFIGRTEEIEEELPAVGSLFVCQVWSGYLDYLLGETNLSLSALQRISLPTAQEIQLMESGELSVLRKNLSWLVASKRLLDKLLVESEDSIKCANQGLSRLRRLLEPTSDFELGLLDAIISINMENLKSLPGKLGKFREAFREIHDQVRETRNLVVKEHGKRKRSFNKRRKKRLIMYPAIVVSSLILALAGIPLVGVGMMTIPFIASASLLHVIYWAYYFKMKRSHYSVGRYPSSSYSRIHTFLLSFTQSIYKLVATGNVVAPTEPMIKVETSESETRKDK